MTSDSKTILFISQYAGFIGGIEGYEAKVSDLLRQQGFETCLLYVEKANKFADFVRHFDRALDMSSLGSIKEEDFALTTLHKISTPSVLEKILERFTPTVFVHDHDYFCPKGYKYYPIGRKNCCRAYSRAFCATCSCIVPPRHFKSGLKDMLTKNYLNAGRLYNLIKTAPRFVVLSNFMRTRLTSNGIDESKITIMHPFLSFAESALQKPVNEVAKIAFAGQQVMSKGTPLFLEAISKLKRRAEVSVIGTGGRLEDFKKLSQEMGLADRVNFLGWVNNPMKYFLEADISVFPSLWQEPFGLSGIEAMSVGTPVVAFDVGGVSEWLEDGINGLLVPERDTSAMANAIDTLIADESLRKTLGENAKKIVLEKYPAEKFLENFRKLL